jgi:hypothetical protein
MRTSYLTEKRNDAFLLSASNRVRGAAPVKASHHLG